MEFSVVQHYFSVKAGGGQQKNPTTKKEEKPLSAMKNMLIKTTIKVTSVFQGIISFISPCKRFQVATPTTEYSKSMLLKPVVGNYLFLKVHFEVNFSLN